jgi:bifunctional UDP-N-acetylglucosamine pyrophosphorylase/glucosamine-1-phosphate N-acetyltransferase
MGSPTESLAVVILAAGQGTRMKSQLSKVLHEAAGRPLLAYPLASARALAPERLVVVVGRDGEQVQAAIAGDLSFVVQPEPRGTGHAVLQARPALEGFRGDVLILYGDTPLLRRSTLEDMRRHKAQTGADLVLLSARMPLPGYVVRDDAGRVARILEATDASEEDLPLEEGNTGVYLVDQELLWKTLAQVDDRNRQGEIYLTDIVALSVADGFRVEALLLDDAMEGLGVNTRSDLAKAAAVLRRRNAERLMSEGVTLIDPDATYLDTDVVVGRDTRIEPGCVIKGATRIGERVHIKAHCTVESSQIDDDVVIGPCAHLRPGTHLRQGARIGNFVEVKNSDVGEGVKADHLSYIGDADVGAGASLGCGAITVNYDGTEKHRTTIGPEAFIGCNANLIAPVSVGPGAFVAAGSTVTRDVPGDSLAVARERQRNVEGWSARRRKRAKDPLEEGPEDASEPEETE